MTRCMIDGRMIGTFPDEHCLRSPSLDKCASINFECPKDFIIANIPNVTIGSPSVPLSFEDAEDATRERQIHDQNRCPPSYELVDIEDKPEEEYGNVGKCV